MNPRCVCGHAYDAHTHLTRPGDLRCAFCPGCRVFRRLWLRPWLWLWPGLCWGLGCGSPGLLGHRRP